MKERYDVMANGQPLKVGDAVWLYNPQRKKRPTRPWEGPHTVIYLVYHIQLKASTKPKVVHGNWLSHYNGSNAPK